MRWYVSFSLKEQEGETSSGVRVGKASFPNRWTRVLGDLVACLGLLGRATLFSCFACRITLSLSPTFRRDVREQK